MTDPELMALSALAYGEAVAMAGENQLRERQGYSPAYCAPGPRYYELEEELIKRNVIGEDSNDQEATT